MPFDGHGGASRGRLHVRSGVPGMAASVHQCTSSGVIRVSLVVPARRDAATAAHFDAPQSATPVCPPACLSYAPTLPFVIPRNLPPLALPCLALPRRCRINCPPASPTNSRTPVYLSRTYICLLLYFRFSNTTVSSCPAAPPPLSPPDTIHSNLPRFNPRLYPQYCIDLPLPQSPVISTNPPLTSMHCQLVSYPAHNSMYYSSSYLALL